MYSNCDMYLFLKCDIVIAFRGGGGVGIFSNLALVTVTVSAPALLITLAADDDGDDEDDDDETGPKAVSFFIDVCMGGLEHAVNVDEPLSQELSLEDDALDIATVAPVVVMVIARADAAPADRFADGFVVSFDDKDNDSDGDTVDLIPRLDPLPIFPTGELPILVQLSTPGNSLNFLFFVIDAEEGSPDAHLSVSISQLNI